MLHAYRKLCSSTLSFFLSFFITRLGTHRMQDPSHQVMGSTCSHLRNLVLLSLLLLVLLLSAGAFAAAAAAAATVSDTLSKARNITDSDSDTLVSADGSFTLGFFSPGASTKRYLGIWYTVSRDVVCWVANRDRPLGDSSGVLVASDTGSLLLLDGGTGQVVWSSNSSNSPSPVEAQLLNSGDLVVRSRGAGTTAAMLWHSFDYPSTGVLLPGMKVGRDLWSGAEWHLTSWRSADDPSPGAYRYVLDTTGGMPDSVIWRGDAKTFRTGPWNGLWYSGIPEQITYANLIEYQWVISPREITYAFVKKPGAPLTYLGLTDGGAIKRQVWDAGARAWQTYYQGPRDPCDVYGKCGAFGVCNASAASTGFCGCLQGFTPASPAAWNQQRDTSGGCRRGAELDCATDGFAVVPSVKLPDAHNTTVDRSVGTVEECREMCLANCSCLAYAAADIRGGAVPSGCIMWTDSIVDLRYVDHGQDMYLRLAQVELPPPPSSSSRPFPVALVAGVSVAAIVLVGLLLLVVIRRRRRRRRSTKILAAHIASSAWNVPSVEHQPSPGVPSLQPPSPSSARTVPSVELSSLKQATGDFSESYILGRGGFGVVYEGHLPNGEKVAVKRLIQYFLVDEGGEAFMREVEVMSKLRHVNLVQLLSYCFEANERVLVYEYMKNKSLNLYIFGEDPSLRAFLNWERRLDIIRGVANGVAYLHGGLNEEVIHRDLKPSNILLDDNWRPKIADFDTAKLFVVDQTDPTLVQTAGYTAPEYLMEHQLTLKCDVYSFGVIVLEIVTGQRNRLTPMLLSNAWEAWNQWKISDLLDPAVGQPKPEVLFELERCVQIGLLCVQQSPEDRPTMSAVVSMLSTKSSQIRPPRRQFDISIAESPLREADRSKQDASGTSGDSYYLT